MSSNRADFEALLWRCGVACDIGNKSILFTIQPGVYGLAEERKCSNWKLISYGDFSGENILKTLDFNDFVQADVWKDYVLVSEVLAELGAINSPDNPQRYEDAFQQRLSPADLEGRSYLEIQEILAERRFRDLLEKRTKELQARIAAEQEESAMLTSSIAGLFDEFEDWLQERKLQQKQLKTEKRKRLKFMMKNMNYISRKTKLFDTKQKMDSLSAYLKNHFHSIE